ncbi:MAG: sugar ABC transporter permease, partial [Limnochordia bacterium]
MGTAVTIQPPKRRDPVRSKLLLSSLLFMGLGHIIYLKQYVKGLFFAAVEITFLAFLPKIFVALENLITLGEPAPHLPIRERPHSMFMLIDGVVVLVLVFVFIGVYIISVRSALAEYDQERTARIGLKEAINRAFPIFGLAPSVGLILLFVVVPLIFSACVAFTNYSSPGHIPPNNT